ncbi:2-oxoacid:acceptor oxidoreductase family protein [Patescibacteria group bacterium]|nr:2-oxoacid:acceptor oxidoreductase family protein [Patescibacteria group bacterium]
MKILIAGEGGQGIQTAAQVLAKAAFKEGKNALYIPNFGVEQRGGASIAFLVIDKGPVVYPKFEKADILAILSERVKKRVERYQGPKTEVISDKNNLIILKKILDLTKIVKKDTVRNCLKEKLGAKFKDEEF